MPSVVIISNTSVPIWNRLHDIQANSRKMTTFRGYPFLTCASAGLLERRGSGHGTAKIYIQWQKFHMQVVLVYLQTFRRRFTLEMCATAQKHDNSLKAPFVGVQGHSRSSMLTLLKSSSPVLVMISSMPVPICKHFHA